MHNDKHVQECEWLNIFYLKPGNLMKTSVFVVCYFSPIFSSQEDMSLWWPLLGLLYPGTLSWSQVEFELS